MVGNCATAANGSAIDGLAIQLSDTAPRLLQHATADASSANVWSLVRAMPEYFRQSPAGGTDSWLSPALSLELLSRRDSHDALLVILAVLPRLAALGWHSDNSSPELGVAGTSGTDNGGQQGRPGQRMDLRPEVAFMPVSAFSDDKQSAVRPAMRSANGSTGGAGGRLPSADAVAARRRNISAQSMTIVSVFSVVVLERLECQAGSPPLVAVDFARRLLRTEILQCYSRCLAAATTELRAYLQKPSPAGAQPEKPARQRQPADHAGGESAGRPAPRWQRRTDAVERCNRALLETNHLLKGLISLADSSAGCDPRLAPDHQRARSAYVSELGAALRDSCLLEHAAQALMLEMQLAGAADEPDGVAAEAEAAAANTTGLNLTLPERLSLWSRVLSCLRNLMSSCMQRGQHGAATSLNCAMSSRCLTHFTAVMVTSTLAAADGGPAYGMPPELVRAVPVLGEFKCSRDSWVDLRQMSGAHATEELFFFLLLMQLQMTGRDWPPGPQAATALILRICRLVLASAQAWAEAQQQQEQQQPEDLRHQRPPLRVLLPRGFVSGALPVVLSCAVDVMQAAPEGAAWVRAASVERWRLAVAAARHVALWSGRDVLEGLGELLRPGAASADADLGQLPLHAPPQLAAALEGGLLPCLERLLRRAAEDPDGPEATVIVAALRQGACDALIQLLAFGDPRCAAALVASLAKALRRLTPQLLAGRAPAAAGATQAPPQGSSDALAPAAAVGGESSTAARALCLVLHRAAANLLAVRSSRMAAGPVAANDAAAAAQRSQLESFVVQELLPQLSFMVQRAALLHDDDNWLEPIRDGTDGGCAALWPLLQWLSFLPQPAPPEGSAAAPPADAATEHLRTFLLLEVGAVPLLGAMLRLYARGLQASRTQHMRRLCAALSAVAAARSYELHVAAAAAVVAAVQGRTQPAVVGASGLSGLTVAEGLELSFWPPRLVRNAAGEVRQMGFSQEADAAEAVAQRLEGWMLGTDSGPFQPPAAQPDDAANAALCAAVHAAFCWPAEARGLLRTCGNPGCTNLAGDSEAELPLKACAGCGVVGYCCRECQTAHWRAGHKAECAGRRGG